MSPASLLNNTGPPPFTVSANTSYCVKPVVCTSQPFKEPIITPFTKCFWTKGYIARTGTLATTIKVYFNKSFIPCLSIMVLTSTSFVGSKLFCIRISLNINCSENSLGLFRKISALKYEFQCPTAYISAITAIIGLDNGSITLTK